MSATPFGHGIFHDRLQKSASWLLWTGLAMTVLGIVAIAFPIVSTLAVTLFVGWIFLVSGIVTLMASFAIHGTGPFFGALLLSLLSTAAGVFLVFNPLSGAVALTLVVGILFIIQGSFELAFAFELRPMAGWGGMLISGLASVVIAIVIAASWPSISTMALGILFGVNFLSTGISYVLVSRAVKSVG